LFTIQDSSNDIPVATTVVENADTAEEEPPLVQFAPIH